MPLGRRPLSAFLPSSSRRFYAVEPAGLWWTIVSDEGEVARYRTRGAAMEGAEELARAMRWLGVDAEVLAPAAPGSGAR